MPEITLDATIENIQQVTEFVNDLLEQHNCSMKTQMQLDLAIDELFGNIAHYAYAPAIGSATVEVTFTESPAAVNITFIDEGIPYNPLAKADPDVTLSAEEREIGGLGIFLVKKTMDNMVYKYENNRNILTITKNL